MDTTETKKIGSIDAELEGIEAIAGTTVSVVSALLKTAKSYQRCSQVGDLVGLRKVAAELLLRLRETESQVERTAKAWAFPEQEEERFLYSGDYATELIACGDAAGVRITNQDTFLAAFPSLIRLRSKDRSISLNGKVLRTLRPRTVVKLLAKNQKSVSKFKPEAFLAELFSAYNYLRRGEDLGGIRRLLDIYDLLTLRSGQKREYSLVEFSRDIYSLDASGCQRTAEGLGFRLHPGATAAKKASNLLTVVTREGVERTYYGIEFFEGEQSCK